VLPQNAWRLVIVIVFLPALSRMSVLGEPEVAPGNPGGRILLSGCRG
jgi:hypothetical protein